MVDALVPVPATVCKASGAHMAPWSFPLAIFALVWLFRIFQFGDEPVGALIARLLSGRNIVGSK